MVTITVLRDADRHRRHEPYAVGDPSCVVQLPGEHRAANGHAPWLDTALDQALARPMAPWWQHWLHFGEPRAPDARGDRPRSATGGAAKRWARASR